MRIAINAIHSKTGSGLAFLNHVLPHFIEVAPHHEFVLICHQDSVPKMEVPKGMEVHAFDFQSTTLSSLIWEQRRLPGIQKRLRADAVWCNANYIPLFCRHAVATIHNNIDAANYVIEPYERLYWFVLRWFTRICAMRSRSMVTVSKEILAGYFGCWPWRSQAKKAVWAPPGGVPRPSQAVRDPYQLLAVGHVYVQKNYPYLLAVLSHLKSIHSKIHLTIVGDRMYQAESDRFDAAVEEFELYQHVTLTGAIPFDDVCDHLARCGIYISVSQAESFSMTTLEALSAGAPSVLGDRPFQHEVASEAALFVPLDDARACAERIALLVNEPQERENLSRQGLDRSKQFQWRRTTQQIIHAIENSVASDTAARVS